MEGPLPPTTDRAKRALSGVNVSGRGLEIGPSFNPIAPKSDGYDVRILDHTTREGLLAKYSAIGVDQEQLDKIEEVDYVWHGEPLSEATNGDKFDYIVAAHVLEHTTDFIGFLNETTSMLREGGRVSLMVPDKRYCFDHFRPLTTAGQVVEAYLRPDSLHGPAAFVDTHLYTVRRHGVENTWDINSLDNLEIPRCSWRTVHHTLDELAATDEYTDIHRWVFTPHSLELLVADLRALGYLKARIDQVEVTDAFEFFVSFARAEESDDTVPERVDTTRRRELLDEIASDEVTINPAHRAIVAERDVLAQQVEELLAHAQELGEHIGELGEHIGELGEHIGRQDAAISAQQEMLEAMEASISWRATQPIRTFKRSVQRRRD